MMGSGDDQETDEYGDEIISEEKIRKDCAFFYETFLTPLPHLEEAG